MKINLSTVAYQVKPKGEEFSKISFVEKEITSVAAFLFECCSGRAVAPIFKKNHDVIMRIAEKRDENFIESHTIFLDFDNERQEPQELISKVDNNFQASCAFSSYSDTPQKRKYHMFWLFEDALNKEQHKLISSFLYEQYKKVSSFDDSIDACSMKCSQMCLGTSKPKSIFNNNEKIFSGAEHFFQLEAFQQWALEREEEECSREEEKHAHKANNTAKNRENVPFIDYNMIKSFLEDSDAVFFEKYQNTYFKGWQNYRYEKPNEWLTSPESGIAYQYTDENYFALPYYIHNGHFSESSSESIKNWFMRELAIAMLINQGADINRVAYRLLLKIREQNVDSEGLLDKHTIIGAMESTATMPTQEIETMYAERLSFLRKVSKLKSGIIIRKNKTNRLIGYSTLLKQIKTEILCSVVDCSSVSVKEAFQVVSEKFPRLDISLNWIQKLYCEMGFAQEKKMTDVGMQLKAIREVLSENPDISQRQLLKKLQEKGISISLGTLNKRLKELQN